MAKQTKPAAPETLVLERDQRLDRIADALRWADWAELADTEDFVARLTERIEDAEEAFRVLYEKADKAPTAQEWAKGRATIDVLKGLRAEFAAMLRRPDELARDAVLREETEKASTGLHYVPPAWGTNWIGEAEKREAEGERKQA